MTNYKIKVLDSEDNIISGLEFVIKNCSYSGKKFNNAVKQFTEHLESIRVNNKRLIQGYSFEYEKVK